MRALLALLLFLLAPVASPQTSRPAADPAPAQAAEVLAELERALAQDQPAVRARAVRACKGVAHPDLILRLATALRDGSRELQAEILEVLRWIDHPLVLNHLHRVHKQSTFLADPVLGVMLYRAIAQHGDKKSAALLAEKPFMRTHPDVISARFIGLGNIREKRSVKKLMELIQRVGGERLAKIEPDFRLAMAALVGRDAGPKRSHWLFWWRDNEKTFRIPPKRTLDPTLEGRWKRFWAEVPNPSKRVRDFDEAQAKEREEKQDDEGR